MWTCVDTFYKLVSADRFVNLPTLFSGVLSAAVQLRIDCLLPTGGEEVLGVGSIPVAILPSLKM